jgi:hypothetical protein
VSEDIKIVWTTTVFQKWFLKCGKAFLRGVQSVTDIGCWGKEFRGHANTTNGYRASGMTKIIAGDVESQYLRKSAHVLLYISATLTQCCTIEPILSTMTLIFALFTLASLALGEQLLPFEQSLPCLLKPVPIAAGERIAFQ